MQSEEAARRIVGARRRPGPGHRDGQPEVRLARLARRRSARPEPRPRAALLPARPAPARGHRRQHAARARIRPPVDAFHRVQARWPDALLVIAPRHPERFEEVTRLVAEEGFRVVRRTEAVGGSGRPMPTSSCSTPSASWRGSTSSPRAVFVGGSLVDAGGHNILEPAVFGKADRLRPAHAQLRRDCRRVPAPAAPRCRCTARASSARGSWTCSAIRVTRAPPGRGRPCHRRRQPRRQGADAGRRLWRCCRPDDGARRGVVTAVPIGALTDAVRVRRRRRRSRRLRLRPGRAMRGWRGRADTATRSPGAPGGWHDRSCRSATSPSAGAGRRPSSPGSPASSIDAGERPAILSRGYARRDAARGRHGRQRRRRVSWPIWAAPATSR